MNTKTNIVLIYISMVVFMIGFGVLLHIVNKNPEYGVPSIILGGVYVMSMILAFTLPLFGKD